MRIIVSVILILAFYTQVKAQINFTPAFDKHWIKEFRSMGQNYTIPITDFDGDGVPDALVQGDTATSIFFGRPNELSYQFIKKTIYRNNDLGYSRSAIVEDFDNDGLTDVVIPVMTITQHEILILRHSVTGAEHNFLPYDSINLTFGNGQLISADLDGDGKTDIIVTSPVTAELAIFPNISTPGNIRFGDARMIAMLSTTAVIDAGDLDGDGKPDLAIGSNNAGSIFLLRNQSSVGNFQFNMTAIETADPTAFVRIAQLNNSGNPEIIAAAALGPLHIYTNNSTVSNLSFSDPLLIGLTYQSRDLNFAYAQAADMDNDGDQDLVLGATDWQLMAYSGYTIFMENSSTPANLAFSDARAVQTNYLNGLGLSDFRNSGNIDAFVLGRSDNTSHVFFVENRQGQHVNFELCPPVSTGTLNAGSFGNVYQWQVSSDGLSFTEIVASANFQNEHTATLSYINLPSAYNGQYLRCVVDGNSAHAQIYKIAFVNHYNNTTGAINDFADQDEWSCHAIPDENTNVIIDAGTIVVSQNTTVYSLFINEGSEVHVEPGVILNVLH